MLCQTFSPVLGQVCISAFCSTITADIYALKKRCKATGSTLHQQNVCKTAVMENLRCISTGRCDGLFLFLYPSLSQHLSSVSLWIFCQINIQTALSVSLPRGSRLIDFRCPWWNLYWYWQLCSSSPCSVSLKTWTAPMTACWSSGRLTTTAALPQLFNLSIIYPKKPKA